MGAVSRVRDWFRDPEATRDDLALQRYDRVVAQIPLLYITMIFVALVSTAGLNLNAPGWVRFGVPVLMSAISAWRVTVWMRRRGQPVSADRARKIIRTMTLIALSMSALCSLWCVLSWQNAGAGEQPYIAIFMIAGALSVAYCLSIIRLAALLCLITGLLPIVILLALTGRPADMASAASVLVACMFLMRMILHQHDQLVALLSLQREMRGLATTDALTGLANRRALYERLEAELAGSGGLAVALIDLDGFKPINDTHGHAAGDALLCATALRLEEACGTDAVAYRLGGDEFALLMPAGTDERASEVAARVLIAMNAPFTVDPLIMRVGASVGWAVADEFTADVDALVAAADRALYAAKGSRARRARHREPLVRAA